MAKSVNGFHTAMLENRQKLTLTGVKEVESLTGTEILLYTELGELTIKGTALEAGSLNMETGDLNVTGEIRALLYGEGVRKVPRNFITKLFR